MKRLFALVTGTILMVSACTPQEGVVQTAIAQTKAYEGGFATNLAGTLAAVATSTAPPTVAVPPTLTPSPTPKPGTPLPIFAPGTTPLAYGDKASSLTRNTVIYGFQGTQGDSVAVSFDISSTCAHTGGSAGAGLRMDVKLRGEQGDVLIQASVRGGLSRTVSLPYTGTYYIAMTCTGHSCADCMQMSVGLVKQ